MSARTELLSSDGDLAALRTSWIELWDRVPSAVPFISPDWLLPWWRQFGTGQPRVATLWRGNQLTGVLPLYVLPTAGRLLPMGVGISDYFDVLVDPEEPPSAASELLAYALSGADGLDCDIPELPPSARLLDATVRNWTVQTEHGVSCPVLEGEIPARQRRKLRMSSNRAARRGCVKIERATVSTAAPAVETLFALHARRWDGGVIADKRVQAFLREATPILLEAGSLVLSALHIAGQPAASILALRTQTSLMFYLGGYDPALSYEGPGTLLMGTMIDEARAQGPCQIDFLRGGEPYKYTWGALDRRNLLLRLTRDGR